jgi:ribosomal protein S18 acetylase RimI-like enzyme
MAEYVIQTTDPEQFAIAAQWAADEGWNPGLDDLETFHGADRQGLLLGFLDGVPIASISVVRYGNDFGFLGFYIVDPQYRGKGYGMAIWRAGMNHLAGRTVGLDGVVSQQDNYRKSGFKLVDNNIRHSGAPILPEHSPDGLAIRPVGESDLPRLHDLDRQCFPAERGGFLRQWLLPGDAQTRRKSLLALRDEIPSGFGTIRQCRSGYKIGPLMAEDRQSARALFAALVRLAEPGAQIILDTPESNGEAVALVREVGMSRGFETARMYRGPAPALAQAKVFGITTFELG